MYPPPLLKDFPHHPHSIELLYEDGEEEEDDEEEDDEEEDDEEDDDGEEYDGEEEDGENDDGEEYWKKRNPIRPATAPRMAKLPVLAFLYIK